MTSAPTISPARAARAARPSYPPIADYALIGDCQTAALVSRSGSIDWFCTPRFDGPSMFAAILDVERGGRFLIQPTEKGGPCTSTRTYIDETNVLETTFQCATGVLRLTDAMSVPNRDHWHRGLWPDHEILRGIECTEGEVEVRILCDPRASYGREKTRVIRSGKAGHVIDVHHGMVFLASEIPLRHVQIEHLGDLAVERWRSNGNDSSSREAATSPNGPPSDALIGQALLRAGERRWMSLSYSDLAPAILMPLGEHAARRMQNTIDWWRTWSAQCTFKGPRRRHVVRSALALKLMTYAPSGAVIAAPTTSLPEWIGGVRNWDYRFCWLRDALMTLRALLDLGYQKEAQAFMSWTLHATGMSKPELLALYDVHGESRGREQELDHFEGYMNSPPVRIGNAAKDQLQLDVYGAVTDAAYDYVKRGGKLDGPGKRMLRGLGRVVCDKWRKPDEGIWEVRKRQRHHTLSKVMCWLTLNCLINLHMKGELNLSRRQLQRFTRERDLIKEVVEARGFNTDMNSYVDELDGDHVDASLMLLALYDYVPADSPRMIGTMRAIKERLGEGGFIHRYKPEEKDDGLPGREGTFTLCGFWYVQCLARQGRIDEANDEFEHMFEAANDLGLFSEEYDPPTGQLLGNFPQAYSHVGVIEAAVTIERSKGRQVDKSTS